MYIFLFLPVYTALLSIKYYIYLHKLFLCEYILFYHVCNNVTNLKTKVLFSSLINLHDRFYGCSHYLLILFLPCRHHGLHKTF